MNDQIKQLAEEAGFLLWEDEPWKPEGAIIDWSSNYDEVLNRYTELIVRECVEQSMSIGRYNTPSGITPDLAIAIAVGLKKHFGVEE